MSSLWNNLLQPTLLGWTHQLVDLLRTGPARAYRLFVRILRKLIPGVIHFRWLETLINRLFPCPQMSRRYINPSLSIEDFFLTLNGRQVRYSVLRWFEDLPKLADGDDIDMLVHEDDMDKIKDLFVVLPTGVICDVYTAPATARAGTREDNSYYPPRLAREILENTTTYKQVYRVPDPERHFLSLAYHAVYHKAEMSGLAWAKDKPATVHCGEHEYADVLAELGKSCALDVSPDLQSLHDMLLEHGWAPHTEELARKAQNSEALRFILNNRENWGQATERTIWRRLNFHGVRLLIESDCPEFINYVERDFCFFDDPQTNPDNAHVHFNFLKRSPPLEDISLPRIPEFKTSETTVYQRGGLRYIDHHQEAFGIYDLKRDRGTLYCDDSDTMYRIAYGVIMTRIGLRLDWSGLHRLHTLGITLGDQAVLFLADGGCGKSTLGLELMKNPEVGWLTDDILVVDSSNVVRAFPTSPRLIIGSVIPWLPKELELPKAPMPKYPPKLQLPSKELLGRVRPSAKLGALFLCSRPGRAEPSIRRARFVAALRGLCNNALLGRDFGHYKAYHFQLSPGYLAKMTAMYLSRALTFVRFARAIPVFRFEMAEGVSLNSTAVLEMYPRLSEVEPPAASSSTSEATPANSD